MTIDLNQFHQVFFEEVKDHLAEMERLLLTLDLSSPDPEGINAVFRAAHSIKGGASTFGFVDMTEVTHVLESMLDKVRHGELNLTLEMVDAALKAGDVLSDQLRGHRDGADVLSEEAKPVIATLTSLSHGVAQEADTPQRLISAKEAALREPVQKLRLTIQKDALTDDQCKRLCEELSRLGKAELQTAGSEQPYCINCWVSREEAEEVLSFYLTPGSTTIEIIEDGVDQAPRLDTEALNADLEGDGFGFFIDPEKVRSSVEDEQGFGFFVDVPKHKDELTDDGKPGLSMEPQAVAAEAFPKRRAADREADSSIRVNIEKVDQLINLVGELVITNAMLTQTVSQLDPVNNEAVFNAVAQLDHNSRDLQEAVMSIRMLPISSVFSRFPRMVREITAKLGKEADLRMVGEGTELDKGLIERLADPLTHLVRNSVDHGIEDPDLRERAGKPRKGRLTLQAFHQGGNIVIEVIDDGAGLNRDRILKKAIEQGLPIASDAPDHDVWQLIFAPGFSTAAAITDVSGRGVGMDVVKRNIEGMGGRVELSSQLGIGTRITIRLPLTLAILDGMSIGVGDQTFIVPINMILESLQPAAEEVTTVEGRGRVVQVRGDYLPLMALHEVFHIVPKTLDPCHGILVILSVDSGKVALFVDELLGQHQVVIKSLESNYRRVPGVSGATIMGDGRVGLILDVPGLIQLSRSEVFA